MKKIILGSALVFVLSYNPFALSGEPGNLPPDKTRKKLSETLVTSSTTTTDAKNTTEKSVDRSSYKKTIHKSTYIGSGIISMVFGFGTGPAIQGRWSDIGWIFTVGNALLIGGMFTVVMSGVTSSFHVKLDRFTLYRWVGLKVLFATYFAFRVWEIIDTWSLPSHYIAVKTPKLQVSPVYTANYRDMSISGLGLSLKYNF